jgi:hypothetical protein
MEFADFVLPKGCCFVLLSCFDLLARYYLLFSVHFFFFFFFHRKHNFGSSVQVCPCYLAILITFIFIFSGDLELNMVSNPLDWYIFGPG